MVGKFPSVRPQKVSSISMKFGIQVVLDRRWKKGNDHARIQGQGQGQEPMKVGNSTILDHFQTISSPICNGGWQMTTDSSIRGAISKI